MEEKILIRGEVDKKTKSIMMILAIVLLVAFVSIFLYFSVAEFDAGSDGTLKANGFEVVFDYYDYVAISDITTCWILFSISLLSFIVGFVYLVIYIAVSKCAIEITEKNVKGRALFGKEVVLPMYMISAYSTRSFLSTISVATSSGITKFELIKNYAEIGNVLSQKINERQENTESAKAKFAPEPQDNSMDDLMKLKGLLDAEVITQEEFEAKKKQLLGL